MRYKIASEHDSKFEQGTDLIDQRSPEYLQLLKTNTDFEVNEVSRSVTSDTHVAQASKSFSLFNMFKPTDYEVLKLPPNISLQEALKYILKHYQEFDANNLPNKMSSVNNLFDYKDFGSVDNILAEIQSYSRLLSFTKSYYDNTYATLAKVHASAVEYAENIDSKKLFDEYKVYLKESYVTNFDHFTVTKSGISTNKYYQNLYWELKSFTDHNLVSWRVHLAEPHLKSELNSKITEEMELKNIPYDFIHTSDVYAIKCFIPNVKSGRVVFTKAKLVEIYKNATELLNNLIDIHINHHFQHEKYTKLIDDMTTLIRTGRRKHPTEFEPESYYQLQKNYYDGNYHTFLHQLTNIIIMITRQLFNITMQFK